MRRVQLALGTSIRGWFEKHFSSTPESGWSANLSHVPRRVPWFVWLFGASAFIVCYGVMWSVVHPYVDLRPCLMQPPDPLFDVIPYSRAWYWVTHDVYELITIGAVCLLLGQAWTGEHRPLVRFGIALATQAVLRSTTMVLLPLCRATVTPGTAAIEQVPYLDLGIVSIPWRVWATNDLVFSGHVGEFLLLFWATRSWPRPIRVFLVVFQLVQAYALIATRGHYTVDVLLAVPCALLADRTAVTALSVLTRPSVVALPRALWTRLRQAATARPSVPEPRPALALGSMKPAPQTASNAPPPGDSAL
jgi:hypothetical protein